MSISPLLSLPEPELIEHLKRNIPNPYEGLGLKGSDATPENAKKVAKKLQLMLHNLRLPLLRVSHSSTMLWRCHRLHFKLLKPK